ncbi:nuclear transport factor 2 family protein [Streptomyces roseirectus]|uniref:Nuclear transport factor 2 family protein n=1 Tax=Streptomyces roseirectus TaxID=2768066 RepID=A0A7H0I7B0_9ACTN|nr:nuclear transport factor 2 family protein [Streptomyces roseirectus]QNP68676.1 nuclear transport factor 2 family protein [Streptomyces roseirectus]
MHAFRSAVERGDMDAVADLLSDDVVFTSPVAFKPYTGKPLTAAILRAVSRVFADFTYIREINDPDGRNHALVFTATVNGRTLQGCDFLHLDDNGLIDDLTVMVRPLSAAQALSEAMGAEFERITQEATAG